MSPLSPPEHETFRYRHVLRTFDKLEHFPPSDGTRNVPSSPPGLMVHFVTHAGGRTMHGDLLQRYAFIAELAHHELDGFSSASLTLI